MRAIYFLVTVLLTALFMVIAILKFKQLSDVMEVLFDDQKCLRARLSLIGKARKRNP